MARKLRLQYAGALMVWPFMADGIFTLLRRLTKKENIFKAHRSHLYQRLVIAGTSHRRVTCVYGSLALLGAVLAWRVVTEGPQAVVAALITLAVAFVLLWAWVVSAEKVGRRQ